MAKEIVKRFIPEGTMQTLITEKDDKGKYGRILGVLWDHDGNNINQKLIKAGLAVEYWGGTKTKVWGDY